MRLRLADPNILFDIGRGRKAHQGYGGKPTGLDERPDQEAVKVVVLTPDLALLVGKTNLDHIALVVSVQTHDVIGFEALQRLVQVMCQSFSGEDELAPEEGG